MPASLPKLPVGGSEMPLYLSLPADVAGPIPAVVVIHHAPGVDHFVREYADRLAAEGYAAARP